MIESVCRLRLINQEYTKLWLYLYINDIHFLRSKWTDTVKHTRYTPQQYPTVYSQTYFHKELHKERDTHSSYIQYYRMVIYLVQNILSIIRSDDISWAYKVLCVSYVSVCKLCIKCLWIPLLTKDSWNVYETFMKWLWNNPYTLQICREIVTLVAAGEG